MDMVWLDFKGFDLHFKFLGDFSDGCFKIRLMVPTNTLLRYLGIQTR